VQASGVPHGYLLVHADPASGLLEAAARRRWLGRALIEAGAQAETATIAVGESDGGAFLVATIAFAYRTGDEAEAALRRLTEKQGDYEALGFAARPGTDRITRQTKLLVVRLDIETDLVLQALSRR
jgi:GNAT superfamily N-acetyltransferase